MPSFRFVKYNSTNPNGMVQRMYDAQNRREAWRFKFFLVKLGFIAFLILLAVIYAVIVR